MSSYQVHKTDVLVVGGGIAAAFAAIRAREKGAQVLLVDKSFYGRSGTSSLASGVFQSYMPGDDLDRWVALHTNPMVNKRALRRALETTYDLLMLMDRWGVKWVKDKGQIVRRYTAIGSPVAVNAMMAEGGPQMMMALRNATLRQGVEVLNRVMVTELLTSDGAHPSRERVVGAVGFDPRSGEPHVFQAKATVLCTGPIHFPYPRAGWGFHGMPINTTGEGAAFAFRAGAELSKMEFLSGWGVIPAEFYCAPGLEMGSALGARFVNAQGEVIAEGAGLRRFRLGRAVIREYGMGRGPVYWDVTHLDPADLRLYKQVVPIVINSYERAGYDPSREKVPYVTMFPFLSGTLGGAGVRIKESGEASLPGLYAAGNNSDGAFIGLAQALNLCAVGGWYSGEAAGQAASKEARAEPQKSQIENLIEETFRPMRIKTGVSFNDLRRELENLYGREITQVLNKARLERGLSKVRGLREALLPRLRASEPRELAKVLSMKNFVESLEMSLEVVLHRTESRGNVLREDFPHIDNENWLKYTFMRREENGRPVLVDETIPEGPERELPERRKVLHPFFKR